MINLIQNCVRNSSNFGPQVLALSPVQRTDKTTSTKAKALGAAFAGGCEMLFVYPADTAAKIYMHGSNKNAENLRFDLKTFHRLYSGLGYGTAYKINQRVYRMAGQGAIQQGMNGSSFDKWLTSNVGEVNRKLALGAVSGAMVGAGEVCLLPLDRLKVQKQINPNSTGTFKEVFSPHGLKAAYRGVGITLMRNIPGSAGFFGGNNAALAAMGTNQKDGSLLQFSMASLIGSTVSLTVSNPADVIKVRVQAVATETNVSTTGVIRSLLVNEGARALFNGLGIKLMTITPKLVFSMTIAQKAGAMISEWVD